MDKCKWCHTRLRVATPILLWNSRILADSRISRLTEGGQIAGRQVHMYSSLALLGMLLLSSSYETMRVRPRLPASYQRLSIHSPWKIYSAMSSEESITADPESKYSQSAPFHGNETKRKKETESIIALLIRSVPFRTRPFLSRFDSAILYTVYSTLCTTV